MFHYECVPGLNSDLSVLSGEEYINGYIRLLRDL